MKDATLRDVLYGLEYAGAKLQRAPGRQGKGSWSLTPSGSRVPPAVADEARRHPRIALVASSPSLDVFGWRAGA